jgi:hypothetical protein
MPGMKIDPPNPDRAAVRIVPASAVASVAASELVPANGTRFEVEIVNGSTGTLLIGKMAQKDLTATQYTASLAPGAYYVTQYRGVIYGFWSIGGTGNAIVTDTSLS